MTVAVENDNPQAKETLFCFAACSDKLPYFLELTCGSRYAQDYKRWAQELGKYSSLEEYLEDTRTEKRLQDVYRSYLGQWDLLNSRRRRAGQYAKKIKDLLPLTNKTQYQLCRELKLNFGNFYAFLKGDNTKLSYEAAVEVYNYVASLAQA